MNYNLVPLRQVVSEELRVIVSAHLFGEEHISGVATGEESCRRKGARELPPNGDEMVFIHPKKKIMKKNIKQN